MLSLNDLRMALDQARYWPGWSFSIHESVWEGPYLRIVATVPDRDDPSKSTSLGINSYLPPFRSVDAFHDWMVWRLCRIATHEVREGYLVAGERPFDPHEMEPV